MNVSLFVLSQEKQPSPREIPTGRRWDEFLARVTRHVGSGISSVGLSFPHNLAVLAALPRLDIARPTVQANLNTDDYLSPLVLSFFGFHRYNLVGFYAAVDSCLGSGVAYLKVLWASSMDFSVFICRLLLRVFQKLMSYNRILTSFTFISMSGLSSFNPTFFTQEALRN